ncbi:MAG: hypothetical protein AB1589_45265, partial [Cyanobacteriota bacterium]
GVVVAAIVAAHPKRVTKVLVKDELEPKVTANLNNLQDVPVVAVALDKARVRVTPVQVVQATAVRVLDAQVREAQVREARVREAQVIEGQVREAQVIEGQVREAQIPAIRLRDSHQEDNERLKRVRHQDLQLHLAEGHGGTCPHLQRHRQHRQHPEKHRHQHGNPFPRQHLLQNHPHQRLSNHA